MDAKRNVIGEELLSLSCIKYLNRYPGVEADLYAPDHLPQEPLDVMIYMNIVVPNHAWAKKHIFYLQNGMGDGGHNVLQSLYNMHFDGYLFHAESLLHLHQSLQRPEPAIYLPFGVDTEHFYPRAADPAYAFDCSYVGNDIKGEERTTLYLMPATQFKLGLFGNWKRWSLRKKLKNTFLFWRKSYQRKLAKIATGKIDQDKVPILYSNTRVNLNFTLQDSVNMGALNLRIIEVLACKGFLITDRIPESEKGLLDGVVCSEGGKDLEDKIRYYLAHPEERQAIAERGYAYILKNATAEVMTRKLYNFLT
ncbi:MAG: hypothetical protein A2Y14_05560 [Verrucomicrobia bacterium GWF2_51_19]|nr:MAG: hypothetical protein A2Y14_05560 [Verrucomicrobia bacterium GWF2_51_19]